MLVSAERLALYCHPYGFFNARHVGCDITTSSAACGLYRYSSWHSVKLASLLPWGLLTSSEWWSISRLSVRIIRSWRVRSHVTLSPSPHTPFVLHSVHYEHPYLYQPLSLSLFISVRTVQRLISHFNVNPAHFTVWRHSTTDRRVRYPVDHNVCELLVSYWILLHGCRC